MSTTELHFSNRHLVAMLHFAPDATAVGRAIVGLAPSDFGTSVNATLFPASMLDAELGRGLCRLVTSLHGATLAATVRRAETGSAHS